MKYIKMRGAAFLFWIFSNLTWIRVDGQGACPSICLCENLTVACVGRTLDKIPSTLPSTTLQLNLQFNSIDFPVSDDSAKRALDRIRSLVYLDLSRNSIYTLPLDVFSSLTMLKSLILSRNYLSSLPLEAFESLESLEVLMVDSNSITSISYGGAVPPASSSSLAYLKELHLNRNFFTSITNTSFAIFRNIEQLHLQENRITDISPWALSSLNLTYLNLGLNRLTADKLTFGNQPYLRELSLYSNKIDALTSTVLSGLTSLETLRMGYNKLSSVNSIAFDYLSNTVQTLFLEGNEFEHDLDAFYDSGLSQMTNLQALGFSFENMTEFPYWICSAFPKLQEVHFIGGSIESLTTDMSRECSHLKVINVVLNEISYIENGAFTNLNFTDLLLDSNALPLLDSNWFALDKVTSNNEELPFISIDNNPIECGCSFERTLPILDQYLIEGECEAPPDLVGMLLTAVNESLIPCLYSTESPSTTSEPVLTSEEATSTMLEQSSTSLPAAEQPSTTVSAFPPSTERVLTTLRVTTAAASTPVETTEGGTTAVETTSVLTSTGKPRTTDDDSARASTADGKDRTSPAVIGGVVASDDNDSILLPAILGALAGVLFIILIIVIIVCLRRRRKKHEAHAQNGLTLEKAVDCGAASVSSTPAFNRPPRVLALQLAKTEGAESDDEDHIFIMPSPTAAPPPYSALQNGLPLHTASTDKASIQAAGKPEEEEKWRETNKPLEVVDAHVEGVYHTDLGTETATHL